MPQCPSTSNVGNERDASVDEAYIGSGDVLIPLHLAPNWHLPIASNCLKEGGIEAVQDYLKNTGSNAQASEGRISSFGEEMFDPEIRVCLNIPQYITYIT